MCKFSFEKFKKNWLLNCCRLCLIAINVVIIAASAHVGYSFAEMKCSIEHLGASADANVTFLMLIPYGIIIGILGLGSYVFYGLHKKSKREALTTEDAEK
jgi:hypothetical protein